MLERCVTSISIKTESVCQRLTGQRNVDWLLMAPGFFEGKQNVLELDSSLHQLVSILKIKKCFILRQCLNV